MDRAVLKQCLEEGLSLRQIGERVESGGGRRRRETAQALRTGVLRVNMVCRHHGETEFVLITGRNRYYCARCRSEAVARRRRNVKRTLVEEAGGKCQLCGYKRCISALQFHHVDPSEKSFALSHAGISRSLEKARAEAQKCVLLCANCHAEVEAGLAAPPVKFTRQNIPA